MPNEGFLAISVFQVISFSILLVLYLFLYRDSPERFFRTWIAGWGVWTAFYALRIVYQLTGGPLERLLVLEFSLIGSALLLAAMWQCTGRTLRWQVLFPAILVGSAALATVEIQATSIGGVHWFTAIVRAAVYLTGGWLVWSHYKSSAGYGGKLLAGGMFLAGLNSLDLVYWPDQAFYVGRVALQDFLNLGLGTAMAVIVLEAGRMRMEDLNEKLRRLSLITAASAQSLDVDQMLGIVLHHLVESLNASHGLVRLMSGSGEGAEAVVRTAIGFSETYLLEHEKISANNPWVRMALAQGHLSMSQDLDQDAESRALMQKENLSAAVLVRLPGSDQTLGWIMIGSTTKPKFHREEITFLINVAGLLAMTVQSVRLFEQVVTIQRQWANTFDSIDDPILVHDPEGKIIRVNQAFESRAGLGFQPLAGKSLSEVLRPGPIRWVRCPYCEGVAGKGNEVDPSLGGLLLTSNSQFHDPNGEPLGLIHVLQDITERRRAEEQYSTLIENVQEGVFIATPEGRFLHCNQAFAEMLGHESREELLNAGNVISGLYANPADRERLTELLQHDGSVSNFEFQIRRKDGEIRTLLESSFVTHDGSGAISAYQGFVLDISERKQAEQEIRRRNRELLVLNAIGQTLNQPIPLQRMLDQTLTQVIELFGGDQGAIFLLDRESGMLSRAAAFGMRSEYASACPATQFPPDLLEHIRIVRAMIISQPGLLLPPIFREIQKKEGLAVSHTVMLWSGDRPVGVLSLGHRLPRKVSVAELNMLTTVCNQIAVAVEKMQLHEETREAYENLRRTQEQLLQSEKMAAVGQLISGVAHELNNPLTAILGYGELLTGTEMVSSEGAQYVAKLHKQAQRSHRIVHNLLSFARQHKPERLPVHVNQIVEDTLSLREYDLRLHQIEVHRQFATDLPQTLADAHQLQQVLLNILNNAMDAILENSASRELWIRTGLDNGRIVIECVDSGPGVTELPRIFDPFYTTKPVGQGTGLGLSICYGIIAEHGGEILVANDPPRGASVTVLLPLLVAEPGPEAPNTAEADAVESGTRVRILLLEEEEAVLELEREILTPRYGVIRAVHSVREAQDALECEPFDLVVTAFKMAGEVSSRELYAWICRRRPELSRRVIFTVSGTGSDGPPLIEPLDGCAFLQKPFSVSEFLAAVQLAIGSTDISEIRR